LLARLASSLWVNGSTTATDDRQIFAALDRILSHLGCLGYGGRGDDQ
jgi:hypothetical protein